MEYHQNFIGSIGLFRIANISKIMRQTFLLTDEIVRQWNGGDQKENETQVEKREIDQFASLLFID